MHKSNHIYKNKTGDMLRKNENMRVEELKWEVWQHNKLKNMIKKNKTAAAQEEPSLEHRK